MIVTRIPKETDRFHVLIRCEPCGTKIALHQKKLIDYQPYLISNWTRHVKECKMFFRNDNKKQSTITQYLLKNSSCSNHRESVATSKGGTEISKCFNVCVTFIYA